MRKYKSLQNLVRKLTTKDCRAYAEELSNTLHTDQKGFWNWINKIKCCRHPVPPIHGNDSLLISDSDKARHFNEYFSSVFTVEDTSSLSSL